MIKILSTPKELTLDTNWVEYCVRVAQLSGAVEAVNIYRTQADFYFNSDEYDIEDIVEYLPQKFELIDFDMDIRAQPTEDAAPSRELDVDGIESPKAIRCTYF